MQVLVTLYSFIQTFSNDPLLQSFVCKLKSTYNPSKCFPRMAWSADLSAMILAETKISVRSDPLNRLAIAVMIATCV